MAGGELEPEGLRRFRELAELLREAYEPHIALEDTDLFPRARRALTEQQLRAVGQEMAARRRSVP